ncbi:MAG: Flp family type IVb pilin [Beijerinckiaceae bacterium]
MRIVLNKLRTLLEDESGATAIEYGILCALIGVGMYLTLGGVRTELRGVFASAGDALKP